MPLRPCSGAAPRSGADGPEDARDGRARGHPGDRRGSAAGRGPGAGADHLRRGRARA